MKTLRILGTLALVAALLPAGVSAQTGEERIQSALDEAVERGIPVSLLESKVEEGKAKGIPMDRIAEAVQHRLDGLARAQEALAGVPDADAGDLSVTADALGSGVSEAVLAEIANTAPRERRSVAIAALTYLVNAEVAPEEALTRVEDALSRGPEALQNLPAEAGVPGSLEIPAGAAGPPAGIPAPGDVPVDAGADGAGPDGAVPPSELPGGRPPIG